MPTIDFATGFENRATAHLGNGFLEQIYVGSNGPGRITTVTFRSGLRAWRNNDTFGSNAYRRFLPQRATRVVACSWLPFGIGTTHCVIWLNDGQVAQVGVRLRTDGRLEITRGNGSDGFPQTTTLAVSTEAITTFDIFHHLEFRATIHNTAGSADVYLNNNPIPIVSVSGVDTQATANAYSDAIGWQGYGVNATDTGAVFDDIYTSDSRLPFADQKILGVGIANGNGDLVGATPKTGTDHGAMISEVTSDEDGTYNIFDAGEIDSYLHPAFGTTSAINFVSIWGRMKKVNYGPVAGKLGFRILGVNYLGAENFLPVGYVNIGQFYNVSPATGLPFTEAELNLAQIVAARTT